MTQSNSHLHHRRTPSSNGSKVRTSRPALHRKGTYSVNHSISKLGSGQVRRPEAESDRQPDMAASFLNFWYVVARSLSSFGIERDERTRLYLDLSQLAHSGLIIDAHPCIPWTSELINLAVPCAKDRSRCRIILFSIAVKGMHTPYLLSLSLRLSKHPLWPL